MAGGGQGDSLDVAEIIEVSGSDFLGKFAVKWRKRVDGVQGQCFLPD